jgi:hypothetical protein
MVPDTFVFLPITPGSPLIPPLNPFKPELPLPPFDWPTQQPSDPILSFPSIPGFGAVPGGQLPGHYGPIITIPGIPDFGIPDGGQIGIGVNPGIGGGLGGITINPGIGIGGSIPLEPGKKKPPQ